jgi:putative transposase
MVEMPIKRLRGHDYREGAYFVTACTHRRRLLFTDRRLTDAVESCWNAIPEHFAARLDVFVVMPNHVHGVLWLERAGHARPLQVVVGSFKSAATRAVNLLRGTPGERVWQRGYYERVVRDESELEALREYVVGNPAAWEADPENPRHSPGEVHAPWL